MVMGTLVALSSTLVPPCASISSWVSLLQPPEKTRAGCGYSKKPQQCPESLTIPRESITPGASAADLLTGVLPIFAWTGSGYKEARMIPGSERCPHKQEGPGGSWRHLHGLV